ncbi:MAG: polysaccharide deacetylase family protein, partial [Roseiflexaceae bacterium]|nr:polysaccharide deacetylase family protein [Roseiflexaceae bacterium]
MLCCGLALAGLLLLRQRQQQCLRLPLLGENLLPNAALVPSPGANTPGGWSWAADGVQLRGPEFSQKSDEWGFDLDGDGRALQLLGIANYVQTPLMLVQPGSAYCFSGLALTDSSKGSSTRLQVVFDWRDTFGERLHEDTSAWQAVALWQNGATQSSRIMASAKAPARAAQLQIRLQPSSDDRVYLDGMAVRFGAGGGGLGAGGVRSPDPSSQPPAPSPTLLPWPNATKAAVSFTFDWETAMGGLIHTRSVRADDPNYSDDWRLRALRMRDGVTTTLDLFRPYGIRATYYATGYNFLDGNAERRQFLGNPTYALATPKNGWPADWSQKPWFGSDPFGTVQSDPAWYFGDLIPQLLAERQDIQSHTFAHFAATHMTPDDWRADTSTWSEVASDKGVAPARSLAFPWSSSNGMSDTDWNVLAEQGFRSVTRLHWSQRRSALFPKDAQGIPLEPRCRPIPGHQSILGCPDFYLRDGSAVTATQAIDRAIDAGGMIDLWAHTEEVTAPSQIATWRETLSYAAQKRDAGELWIAPFSEVADWQQALESVSIQNSESKTQNERQVISFTVVNDSKHNLQGLTLKLPMQIQRASVDGVEIRLSDAERIILNAPAQRALEVIIWPA